MKKYKKNGKKMESNKEILITGRNSNNICTVDFSNTEPETKESLRKAMQYVVEDIIKEIFERGAKSYSVTLEVEEEE